jgi:hypothetical protein
MDTARKMEVFKYNILPPCVWAMILDDCGSDSLYDLPACAIRKRYCNAAGTYN